ncbi:hypothetical protein [Mesorhizobium sp. M7A.F.Ca.US.011.01.1.1]|uniref:hypothetical protein n=1 Tax=Mesorhizobium sp. M7A.F.Ca.US.011.01.1.1 TaxID=2496741 RepID=UPI0013E3A62A|nr:hypothetical protein [Mesorhizobium sp. M7A.F.Ca.US.011.01.1.1]
MKSIPYGLAPINEVNAVARRTMLGDVVMVAENLRYFFYFMNIAMYGPYSEIRTDDCIDTAIIALRIMRGSESFDFDLDPRATLPAQIEREIQSKTGRQMEFTFGHEFAHLLEGHLVDRLGSDDLRVYSHECEFAADCSAVLAADSEHETKRTLARGAFVPAPGLLVLTGTGGENQWRLMGRLCLLGRAFLQRPVYLGHPPFHWHTPCPGRRMGGRQSQPGDR